MMDVQITYKITEEQQDKEWITFMQVITTWNREWDHYDYQISKGMQAKAPKDLDTFREEFKEKYVLIKK